MCCVAGVWCVRRSSFDFFLLGLWGDWEGSMKDARELEAAKRVETVAVSEGALNFVNLVAYT